LPSQQHRAPSSALVFDACNVGVVLRAVLFVQAVVATAAMFGAESPLQWLERMALLTGAGLPGTLAWLVAACLLKHPLQRLRAPGQYAAGVLLGMAAGLYACAMLQLAGGASAPWLASAMSGGLLAALLVAALVLRARGHTPADTQARLAELQSRIRPHFRCCCSRWWKMPYAMAWSPARTAASCRCAPSAVATWWRCASPTPCPP
jgi:two-component system sensor histidine kinase AlgZ